MPTTPGPGALVEVDHAGRRLLALVRDERRGLLDVLTEVGDRLKLSPAKILRDCGHTLPNPEADDSALKQLAVFRERLDEAVTGLDLETIWALCAADEAEPMSAAEMAELWFDDRQALSTLATEMALQADDVYFKRRGDTYLARPEREVEQLRQQVAKERERNEARGAFIAEVTACLEAEDAGRSERLHTDPAQRIYTDLLTDFATFGDTFDRRAEAIELLESIHLQAAGAQLKASAAGAFRLLLKLGLVEPHENLALRRYRIRARFDDGVEAAAEALAASAPEADLEAIEDLTARPLLTIDDAHTRDIDDALHIRRQADGSIEVGVHITDVASLVRPGSPVDLEARKRGSSVYLPDGVIPMLPRVLSEDRLSLVAGQERQTLSFLAEFDPQGELVRWRIVPARVRVRERLTYVQADAALADTSAARHSELALLIQLAEHNRRRRLERGAVEIDLPDIDVELDGDHVTVTNSARTPSRFLVSELMILAGEITASFCLERTIPAVFRTQEPAADEQAHARVEAIEDPLARELERTRLLRRGELRSQPAPHRGLGLAAYVQATSPLRRYADLIAHYQMRAHLLGMELPFGADEMVQLAARAESAASDCVSAQRDTDRYWLLEYLRRQPDDTIWEAVVLDFDPTANRPTAPVLLTELMLKSRLPARGLSVGQRLKVRVTGANPRRDSFRLARV